MLPSKIVCVEKQEINEKSQYSSLDWFAGMIGKMLNISLNWSVAIHVYSSFRGIKQTLCKNIDNPIVVGVNTNKVVNSFWPGALNGSLATHSSENFQKY